MKLSKAIEILHQLDEEGTVTWEKEHSEACQLGIEALIDFKRHRGQVASGHYRMLLGETSEGERFGEE